MIGDGAIQREQDARALSALVHDVNNALNPIMAAAYLLNHHAESPELVREYAARITEAAESAALAVARIATFNRHALMATPVEKPILSVDTATAQHILVVEDHDESREFLRRLLRANGHRVDAVGNCADARARLVVNGPPPYHLLLTDVDLPDGSGWHLLTFAKQHLPTLRVGVITGWEPMIGSEDAAGAEFILRKPLRAVELLAHVAGRTLPGHTE